MVIPFCIIGLTFPGDVSGKRARVPMQERDEGLIPGLGRSPGGGHDNSLQYSCLENPHEQRSLVGYSAWGRKELDTIKQLNTAQHDETQVVQW